MNKPVAHTIFLSALIFQSFVPALAAEENFSENKKAVSENNAIKKQSTENQSADVLAEDILDLRWKKTFGITVGLHPPLRNRTSEQFLLSIDGENLRNNSFDQIKKKLGGPQGSSVKVGIGYPSGDTETFVIRREPNKRRFRNSNQDPFVFMEGQIHNGLNSFVNILETTTCNSDLIGKARSIRALKECEKFENKVAVYLNCMLLSQAIGDFHAADDYLALALSSIKTDPPISHTGFREKAVVQNLALLGKTEEAEAICKYLLLPEPNRVPRLPAAITVLDSYSLIPSKSAKEAARKLAARIVSGEQRQVTFGFHQDSYWFAQYLESLGWNDKAIEIYSKQLERLQKNNHSHGFYGRQAAAYGHYSRSRLEALAGKRDIARKDLEAVKEIYLDMSPKQQELINQIPVFFPTFTDIEIALSALNKSGSIKAPPRAVTFSNQDHFIIDGFLDSFKRNLRKAQKCSILIEASNKKDAEKVAEELVAAYDKSTPSEFSWRVRQNLFCTCLGIARAFADQGWYQASDRQLDLLEAAARKKAPEISSYDLAWVMLKAERIYNAKASGKKPELFSLKGPASLKEGRRRLRQPWPNRLGTLAMAYHYAGYPKRAKFFIDQSIQELKKSNQLADTNVDTRRIAELNAKLFIDAASIYAKLSDFRMADNYLDHAFKNQVLLDESVAKSCLESATIYSDQGRDDKAIAILKKSTALKPPRYRHRYVEKIEVRLAELLGKNGKPEKGLVVIEELLGKSKSPANIDENLIAAVLSEQSKKYNQAAKYYYEAGKWHGSKTKKQREKILRKALTCADKVPDFDKALLAQIYLKLSGVVERTDLSVGLRLREKAVSLMSDSDPEKPKQLSVIAYIKRELSKQKKGTASDPEIKRAQQEESIAVAKQAAEMAAKNNSKDARTYWLRLARTEAEAKRIDKAVEHAQKCIEAYQPVNVRLHTLYDLVTSNLPLVIAKAGSPDKAEKILKAAQKRVESVAGVGSLQAQAQMSHYFQYLVLHKEYSKAEKILDKFLSTKLDQGRYSPPNHDMHICRFGGGPYPVESSMQVIRNLFFTIKNLVKNKETRQALRFLNKILNAEIKQFGKGDYRVALTYAEIGRAHSAAGENEQAYEAYTSAVAIMHGYEDMMFVLYNLHPDFYSVLRKLDKKSEIERFEEQKLEDQKNRQARIFGRKRRNAPTKR